MTFTNALIASGYYIDPPVGSYCQEDKNGNYHTYLELDNGSWSYVKYSSDDEILASKVFSLT